MILFGAMLTLFGARYRPLLNNAILSGLVYYLIFYMFMYRIFLPKESTPNPFVPEHHYRDFLFLNTLFVLTGAIGLATVSPWLILLYTVIGGMANNIAVMAGLLPLPGVQLKPLGLIPTAIILAPLANIFFSF